MVDENAIDDLKFKAGRIIAVFILPKNVRAMFVNEATEILDPTFVNAIFKSKLRDGMACLAFGIYVEFLLSG